MPITESCKHPGRFSAFDQPLNKVTELFPQGYFQRTWGSRFSNPATSLTAEVPGDAICLLSPGGAEHLSHSISQKMTHSKSPELTKFHLSFDSSKVNSNKTHMSPIMN